MYREEIKVLDCTIRDSALINNYQFSDKFNAWPVYKVIQKQFAPLRKSIEWGFNDIYGISGHLNQHPRTAMKLRADIGKMDNC